MRPGGVAQVIGFVAVFWLAIGAQVAVVRADALFVRGAVSGEWSAPTDTVIIDSFAWVPAAETLRIAPGMVVAFSGRFSLLVTGTLLAEGTATDSIYVQRTPLHDPLGHLGVRFRQTQTVSRLAHVVIEDGFANLGGDERFGGALEVYFAEIVLDSCWLRENRARIDGGAIYGREAATLTIRDCIFSGDSTRFGAGGAILSRSNGTLRLERCEFYGNKAITHGGALAMESGVQVELTDCRFHNNRALQRGGAVQLRGTPGTGFARGCVFDQNAADIGGALYLENTRATLEACSLRWSGARLGGAVALRGLNNQATLRRLTIHDNLASAEGGALHIADNARCAVENSVIMRNDALQGGGVYVAAGTIATLRYLTTTDNHATDGREFYFGGGGLLTSSIVSGLESLIHLAPGASPQLFRSNIYASVGDELTGFVVPWLLDMTRVNVALVPCDTFRNISADPQFADAALDDYRLLDGSPCLFGADTSGAVRFDYSGDSRPQPIGSWPDMGAFESAAALPSGEHCGFQSGVWYPGDYVIGCTLRVAEVDTLLIMAGTRVMFAPGASLHVDGTLLALGTDLDSIVFDRYFELPGSTWNGIVLGATSRTRFEYTAVRRVIGVPAIELRGTSVELRHCSITDNDNRHGDGGGLYAPGAAHALLQSCAFTDNIAGGGGAVSMTLGSLTTESSLFRGNEAALDVFGDQAHGGAIAAQSITVRDSRFADCRGFLGGAVAADSAVIYDSEFEGCWAARGGALAARRQLNLDNVTFRGNEARLDGGALALAAITVDHSSQYFANHAAQGGAISLSDSAAYIGDSVVWRGNIAEQGGAVYARTAATSEVVASELHGNLAELGGALYCDRGVTQFTLCLFDSNTADAGGAVYLDNGLLRLQRSTCVNQQSAAAGSVAHARLGSTLIMNSTILADNGADPLNAVEHTDYQHILCDVPTYFGAATRTNFNGDTCDAAFNLIADPEFVDAGARDYRLTTASPAIQAGDPLWPLDADGTRSDIGYSAGVRPYVVPTPFNVTAPERGAHFVTDDSIRFAWNESRDGDPGDTVSYRLHLTGEVDSVIATGGARSVVLTLDRGQYEWWVEAQSLRPETAQVSYERRGLTVADAALGAGDAELPGEFAVTMAGPNPFNSMTRLDVALPHPAHVTLMIYDVLGRTVQTIERDYTAGVHGLSLSAQQLSTGFYWAEVRAGEQMRRVKLAVIR